MPHSTTVTPRSLYTTRSLESLTPACTALVIVWAEREPARLGEVLLLPPHPGRSGWLIGRGAPDQDGPWKRVYPTRQRPGKNENAGWLETDSISHKHLHLLLRTDGTLEVESVGKVALLHNGLLAPYTRSREGREVQRVIVQPGDLLEIYNQLVFLCVSRSEQLPALPPGVTVRAPRFGKADHQQMVGESPALWRLRIALAQLAREKGHVLIRGASGSGKELAAHAIHTLSSRGARGMTSRNAATFPRELIDAELFGNLKNYPNPGMLERPGLIGQADGSTLFLDEIGELQQMAQTHLLRVMDTGEYQRLGESTPRCADLRFIGATNQPLELLREDFAARFDWQIELPGLNERREDIPLLVRDLLRRFAMETPDLASRYFERGDFQAMPRLSPHLMSALVAHRYTTHARELGNLLRKVRMDNRQPSYLELNDDLRRELGWPERPSPGLTRRNPAHPAPLPEGFRTGDASGRLPGEWEPGDGRVRSARLAEEERSPSRLPTLEEIFDQKSLDRLARFQAVGFNMTTYAEKEGVSTQAANTWLQRLMFRAIAHLGFSIELAAQLLAAQPDEARALQRRIGQRLDDLLVRLQDEGEDKAFRKLKELYGTDCRWVMAVLKAQQRGEVK